MSDSPSSTSSSSSNSSSSPHSSSSHSTNVTSLPTSSSSASAEASHPSSSTSSPPLPSFSFSPPLFDPKSSSARGRRVRFSDDQPELKQDTLSSQNQHSHTPGEAAAHISSSNPFDSCSSSTSPPPPLAASFSPPLSGRSYPHSCLRPSPMPIIINQRAMKKLLKHSAPPAHQEHESSISGARSSSNRSVSLAATDEGSNNSRNQQQELQLLEALAQIQEQEQGDNGNNGNPSNGVDVDPVCVAGSGSAPRVSVDGEVAPEKRVSTALLDENPLDQDMFQREYEQRARQQEWMNTHSFDYYPPVFSHYALIPTSASGGNFVPSAYYAAYDERERAASPLSQLESQSQSRSQSSHTPHTSKNTRHQSSRSGCRSPAGSTRSTPVCVTFCTLNPASNSFFQPSSCSNSSADVRFKTLPAPPASSSPPLPPYRAHADSVDVHIDRDRARFRSQPSPQVQEDAEHDMAASEIELSNLNEIEAGVGHVMSDDQPAVLPSIDPSHANSLNNSSLPRTRSPFHRHVPIYPTSRHCSTDIRLPVYTRLLRMFLIAIGVVRYLPRSLKSSTILERSGTGPADHADLESDSQPSNSTDSCFKCPLSQVTSYIYPCIVFLFIVANIFFVTVSGVSYSYTRSNWLNYVSQGCINAAPLMSWVAAFYMVGISDVRAYQVFFQQLAQLEYYSKRSMKMYMIGSCIAGLVLMATTSVTDMNTKSLSSDSSFFELINIGLFVLLNYLITTFVICALASLMCHFHYSTFVIYRQQLKSGRLSVSTAIQEHTMLLQLTHQSCNFLQYIVGPPLLLYFTGALLNGYYMLSSGIYQNLASTLFQLILAFVTLMIPLVSGARITAICARLSSLATQSNLTSHLIERTALIQQLALVPDNGFMVFNVMVTYSLLSKLSYVIVGGVIVLARGASVSAAP